MIRVLFGSAFTLFGLGLAIAFTGPGLVTGIGGTPMVVAWSERAALVQARFDGAACAPKLLRGEEPKADEHPGMRIVAFALRRNGEAMEIAIRDIPGDAGAPIVTVALLFDEMGRLAAVGKEPALRSAARDGDCAKTPATDGRAPI